MHYSRSRSYSVPCCSRIPRSWQAGPGNVSPSQSGEKCRKQSWKWQAGGGRGRRPRRELERVHNFERGEEERAALATRVDILIVMNRPRYRGAIRAFRPPPLRAEFVSHTTRRQNSRENSDEMFLLPIITHDKAEEGERASRR